MKSSFSLPWFLWLLFVWQGCTSIVKSNVTITLDDGQRITLCFEYLYGQDATKPFRELLEKLEAGEDVDINKSLEELFTYTPLMQAITHALGRGNYDPHFYAARYLLEHDADPNVLTYPPDDRGFQTTAAHNLCRSLRGKREVGIRGLALFLSYGARLGIKDTNGRKAINYLEKCEPWISEELRKKYEEEPDSSQEGQAKPLHDENKPPAPPAYKSAISQERQKELKKAYFTEVAEALRKLPQYRESVDKEFLNYIQKAGVDDNKLLGDLRAKIVF